MGSSRDQLRLNTRYTARDCKFKRATQEELDERMGGPQRMMAYYEQEGAQPPGALVVNLAAALKVSADELLGLSEEPEAVAASNQTTVVKIVDALAEKDGVEAKG